MRTRHSLSLLHVPGVSPVSRAGRSCGGGLAPPGAPPVAKPALLLVSNDIDLCVRLRGMSGGEGRSVVEAGGLVEALQAVRSVQFAAVMLDLDLPSQGAWQVADGLLQEEDCPPLILLTGRRDQFDVSTAIRAGTLIDKAADCGRLMEAVEQAVGLTDGNRVERNAIQRIVIQWLRPCAWSVPVVPTYRHWGLNE
jgi:CheY-like chemotaxis protein